jgi:hypothetical protein
MKNDAETQGARAIAPKDLLAELQQFKLLHGLGVRLGGFKGGAEIAIIAPNAEVLKAAWGILTAGKLELDVSKAQHAIVLHGEMPIFSANDRSYPRRQTEKEL